MLDNIKLSTENQNLITRLHGYAQSFMYGKSPQNNNYECFALNEKVRFEFRKVIADGKLMGYRHIEINLSPHYHFNDYLHNGNDFTPNDCIKSLSEIFHSLQLEPQDYDQLKVVNIEFGLNIIPATNIKNLIDGLYFYKKTAFKTGAFPYFKKTDATTYKQIKAYAKGLQFLHFPQYGIHPNTFRFEVKSKQAKNIEKYGIWNADDLTKFDIYKTLSQILLDEWENNLLINQTPDFSNLKPDEVQFIQSANKIGFWSDMVQPKYRNKFGRFKEKYYKVFTGKDNQHTQIKGQIIDKLNSLLSGANSTQPTPVNTRKVVFTKTPIQLINLESAPPHQNNRVCLVTGLDISMQRKRSKFLCKTGLKYYKEIEPTTYKEIELKYLTEKMKRRPIEEQIYYMAHNIRNKKTNLTHNPKYNRQRFEKRNYHHQQLQFNFQF